MEIFQFGVWGIAENGEIFAGASSWLKSIYVGFRLPSTKCLRSIDFIFKSSAIAEITAQGSVNFISR